MSNNLPPGSPGGPEYLEMGSGGPIPPHASPDRPAGRSTRRTLAAGGALGALALAGAGAWAVWSFFSTGAQPAEALPAGTIAYASVDLDPSGGQKIEALRMLRKFPVFEDRIGLGTDDDVRRWIVEEILKDAPCDDLSWSDFEPWLGNRAAVAAVDDGDGDPAPVFVVQVTDGDAAREGMAAVEACGTSGDDTGSGTTSGGGADAAAWRVEGDWALVAESDEVLDRVSEDTASGSLADDEDFRRWTEAAGDPGVMTFYAAPEAGEVLAHSLETLGGLSSNGPEDGGTSDELTGALEDFRGMAATVRFADGGLELEVAGDPGLRGSLLNGEGRGDQVLSTLPADTAVAVGAGLDEGWLQDLAEDIAARSGGGLTADELLADLARASGLDLPADADTLAGDALVVAVGPALDPERFFTSGDGDGLPVALKVQGDPDGIEAVLDKLRPQIAGGLPDLLDTDSSGNLIAIGPDADYRRQVLERGELGSSAVFQHVVPDAERADLIGYANFDAGDWLVRLAGGDEELRANLEPLEGLGLSSWSAGDTVHARLRLTAD